MAQFDRKDAQGLSLALLMIALIPVGLWLTRPRPLSANSSAELTQMVRTQREDIILDQMRYRYDAVSLNMEGPDTGNDPVVRWQEMEEALEGEGAEPGEARQVIQIAKSNMRNEWPCLVEKGIIRGEVIWLVAGSSPHDTGFISWICIPSPEDIHREKVSRYCTDVRVVAVSTRAPYRVVQ